MRQIIVVVVVLLAVGILALLLWPTPAPVLDRNAPARTPAVGDQPAPAAAAAGRPATAGSGAAVADSPSSLERIDAATRARLLAAIGQRLAAATAREAAVPRGGAGQGGGAGSPSSAPAGHLDKEYIQAQVREIVPLIKECFEQVLEQQPTLSARVTVRFTIEGDPELGGVISSSEIVGADGGVQPGSLDECVRETMYALKLQAPEGGGTVTVTYPFKFSSSPD